MISDTHSVARRITYVGKRTAGAKDEQWTERSMIRALSVLRLFSMIDDVEARED